MGWLNNFFNPGEEDRKELETAYNEAYSADISTPALEELEEHLEQQGYKVHWNGVTQQFELMDD